MTFFTGGGNYCSMRTCDTPSSEVYPRSENLDKSPWVEGGDLAVFSGAARVLSYWGERGKQPLHSQSDSSISPDGEEPFFPW